MTDLTYLLLVALTPAMLLAVGLLPSQWANRHVAVMRQLTLTAALGSLILAVGAAGMLVARGPLDAAPLAIEEPVPLSLGVYFDSLAAIVAVMIAFIGVIIARFAGRYLEGEASHGRFLRWISFTLGAVLLVVISRNLVMFTAAWMLTSFGLHQLLTHYGQREQAVWAARKKFVISRLGDIFLLSAMGLTWYSLGSVEYPDIFAHAAALADTQPLMVTAIALLFVAGAMTKSAQVPFHSWLPDTMETPTPVSALMHAGIINAGGFLIIRLSPLMVEAPIALHLLAIVGGVTALFASLVMLTQTSVKRSLAWSTIAQMGFMMLQCGLGAFSAALLHLVAHSAYKAHAFLSSGSVLDAQARIRTTLPSQVSTRTALAQLPLAILIALGFTLGASAVLGLDLASKPGGLAIGVILTLAMTHLIWHSLQTASTSLIARSLGAAAGVAIAYVAVFLLIDTALAYASPATGQSELASMTVIDGLILAAVAIGFFAVLITQALAPRLSHTRFMQSLYVHASNEFYLSIPAQRLTAHLWGRRLPI